MYMRNFSSFRSSCFSLNLFRSSLRFYSSESSVVDGSKESKAVTKRGRGRPRKVVPEGVVKPKKTYYVKKGNRKKWTDVEAAAAAEETLSTDDLEKEIARHEEAHREWLKELEENRAEMIKFYQAAEEEFMEEEMDEEEEEEELFSAPLDEPLQVRDTVRLVKMLKARDVVVFDLRHKTDLCEFMIICTSNSPTHARGLCDAVMGELKKRKKYHFRPVIEGRKHGEWILIQAGRMIIHIFEENMRMKYNFEAMWGLRRPEELQEDDDWEADLFPEFSRDYDGQGFEEGYEGYAKKD